VLGDLETQKFAVFSGGDLEKHETTVARGGADDQVLEHPTATEADSWIRRCNGGTGEEGYGAAVDRRQPRSWRKECYI
jgi:hypothetical protein